MKKSVEEMLLSWHDIARYTQQLTDKIRGSGFIPDYLAGITRGGLVPLALLSEKLNIANIITFSTESYHGKNRGDLQITFKPSINLHGKKVLLVDEIADSGTTLCAIADILKDEYQVSELKTAVISYNTDKCSTLPDFYIFGDNRWIVFPWEESLRN